MACEYCSSDECKVQECYDEVLKADAGPISLGESIVLVSRVINAVNDCRVRSAEKRQETQLVSEVRV